MRGGVAFSRDLEQQDVVANVTHRDRPTVGQGRKALDRSVASVLELERAERVAIGGSIVPSERIWT